MANEKFLTTVGLALAVVALPLGILNAGAGLVAGIWFIMLGHWSILLNGILALVISSLLIPFAMAPSALVAIGAGAAFERGKRATAFVLIALGNLWVAAVTVFWELGVFHFFQRYVDRGFPQTPVWLLAYGVATGVFAWMANKSREGAAGRSEAAHVAAAQLAFIIFSICFFWLGWTQAAAVAAMLVPLILQVALNLLSLGSTIRRQ